MGFDKDFVWGAATAAYQIEGEAFGSGKGLNIWDSFSHQPNKIYENHNGDVACDHYHKMEQDVEIMKQLGLKAYRFSISWARVLPSGTGKVNKIGLDFYSRLVDLLLENGIEPYVTLYHWDLPHKLHTRGGWLNPESVGWFAKYADLIAKTFGARVKNYITFNEPQVFVGLGYMQGTHAPGYRLGNAELLEIGRNILLAHGEAVRAIRKQSGDKKIGIVMACSPPMPETRTTADIAAAKKAYEHADIGNFIFTDSYWLDPIIFGKYPDALVATAGELLPELSDEEREIISTPIDFIGSNIYRGRVIRSFKNRTPCDVPPEPGAPLTANHWIITPDALYWGARCCVSRYGKPFFITENGMAAHDVVSLDGEVHDPNRIDYLHRYLRGLRRAADEGLNVAGYFAWSLMDNFEWAEGYRDRFGLVFVDYKSGERIIKDSGRWYSEVIKNNGENL